MSDSVVLALIVVVAVVFSAVVVFLLWTQTPKRIPDRELSIPDLLRRREEEAEARWNRKFILPGLIAGFGFVCAVLSIIYLPHPTEGVTGVFGPCALLAMMTMPRARDRH